MPSKLCYTEPAWFFVSHTNHTPARSFEKSSGPGFFLLDGTLIDRDTRPTVRSDVTTTESGNNMQPTGQPPPPNPKRNRTPWILGLFTGSCLTLMVVLIAIAAGNTKPATTTTRPAAPVMGQHEIDMLSWRLVVGEAVTGAHGISDETIDNMADAFCQIADGSNGNGFIFGATILAVGEDYGFGPTEVGAMAGASLEMRCPWHSDILAEYR